MEHEIVSPEHCFCHYDIEELRPWVEKRFGDKIDTIDLLKSAKNEKEKELISIVALLDVTEEEMLKMMGDINMPEHHIVHCRENVKALLNIK